MKTLEEVVSALERCTDYEAECEGCPYRDDNKGGLECEMRNLDEVLYYLKQYQDARTILNDDRIISYWGRLPVVQIGKDYYAVRDYVKRHRGWRCHKLSADEFGWYNDDDENYIIDRNGKIICKEYGWDLREAPYYDDDGTEANKA